MAGASATADAPSLLRLQLGKVAARWRKGQILSDLGRKDEAQAAARKALQIDPRHRGARELLARLGQG